jgi:hypothetical protein
MEESLRNGLEAAVLRPAADGTLEVVLQLPHRAWPLARVEAREQEFAGSQLTALGVRHGLAGEGLFELAQRASPDPFASLPVNRVTPAAIGLFAQDWIGRVKWVENALGSSTRVRRALERQRAFEAARFLAALELHAEGISLAEVASSFQRRTGVDPDVAAVEALRAERDPLHGLAFLGWLELRDLEQRLAARSTPRRGLTTALGLVFKSPGLRPSDLGKAARGADRAAR